MMSAQISEAKQKRNMDRYAFNLNIKYITLESKFYWQGRQFQMLECSPDHHKIMVC